MDLDEWINTANIKKSRVGSKNMTDKHTNSFEERNFKTQQDQADFRMQQMLKEKDLFVVLLKVI